jgi:hypothetical protein
MNFITIQIYAHSINTHSLAAIYICCIILFHIMSINLNHLSYIHKKVPDDDLK